MPFTLNDWTFPEKSTFCCSTSRIQFARRKHNPVQGHNINQKLYKVKTRQMRDPILPSGGVGYTVSAHDVGQQLRENIRSYSRCCVLYIILGNSWRLRAKNRLHTSEKIFPSALWCLHMAHQTKIHPMECGSLYVTDNFYTCHVLTKTLLILTDGEAYMLCTVIINTVDGINRVSVKKVISMLENLERGSWVLVEVLDKVTRTSPVNIRAERCGYIAFKDRKWSFFIQMTWHIRLELMLKVRVNTQWNVSMG